VNQPFAGQPFANSSLGEKINRDLLQEATVVISTCRTLPPIAGSLLASRGDALPATAVVGSVRRPGQPLTERAVNYILKNAAARAGVNPAASVHWLRHAHASHAIDNGAPITLVSATLGHADLKTTSVYAHARPGESSGRYLKTK
jgi:integrase